MVNNNIKHLICTRLYPNACPFVLVQKFFAVYSSWQWPTPVMLRDYEDLRYPDSDGRYLPVWNCLLNYRDSLHLMPIITPTYPAMNSAYNVTRPQFRAFQMEIIRAHMILQSHGVQKDFPWSQLFASSTEEFFKSYPRYIQIDIRAKTAHDHRLWFGWVESRMRYLIVELEKPPEILCHPIANCFHRRPDEDNEGPIVDFEDPAVWAGTLPRDILLPDEINARITVPRLAEESLEEKGIAQTEASGGQSQPIEPSKTDAESTPVVYEPNFVTPQKRKGHVTIASNNDEDDLFVSTFFIGLSFHENATRVDVSREIQEFADKVNSWKDKTPDMELKMSSFDGHHIPPFVFVTKAEPSNIKSCTPKPSRSRLHSQVSRDMSTPDLARTPSGGGQVTGLDTILSIASQANDATPVVPTRRSESGGAAHTATYDVWYQQNGDEGSLEEAERNLLGRERRNEMSAERRERSHTMGSSVADSSNAAAISRPASSTEVAPPVDPKPAINFAAVAASAAMSTASGQPRTPSSHFPPMPAAAPPASHSRSSGPVRDNKDSYRKPYRETIERSNGGRGRDVVSPTAAASANQPISAGAAAAPNAAPSASLGLGGVGGSRGASQSYRSVAAGSIATSTGPGPHEAPAGSNSHSGPKNAWLERRAAETIASDLPSPHVSVQMPTGSSFQGPGAHAPSQPSGPQSSGHSQTPQNAPQQQYASYSAQYLASPPSPNYSNSSAAASHAGVGLHHTPHTPSSSAHAGHTPHGHGSHPMSHPMSLTPGHSHSFNHNGASHAMSHSHSHSHGASPAPSRRPSYASQQGSLVHHNAPASQPLTASHPATTGGPHPSQTS
eukprot:gene6600-4752_t